MLPDSDQDPVPRRSDPLGGLPMLLSVPRAAAILGVSRAAAYRYAADGVLPSRRLGGRVYVVTAGLQDFVDAA